MAHGHARVFGCGRNAGNDFAGKLVELGVNIFVIAQVTHSGVTRRHCYRIPGERSGLIHRPERCNQIHDFAGTSISAHRQPSANDLAHGSEIGLNPVEFLRATECQPKSGHDLVENQQRLVVLGDRSQSFEVSERRGHASHVAHHRFHDDTGDLILEFFESLFERFAVVEWKRKREPGEFFGHARRARNAKRGDT